MKNKKILCLILAAVLLVSLVPAMTLAASTAQQQAADALNTLGLFSGVGTDEQGKPIYSLDRAPTRAEGVTLLVRFLGKEDAAQKEDTDNLPFTDVPDWAKPYVAYAYRTGLSNGVSADRFGTASEMSATQYLTFLLRALGYKDGTDFKWDSAWTLTDKLNITSGQFDAAHTAFTRGDAVQSSVAALSATVQGGSKADTLLATLVYQGAVTTAAVKLAKLDAALIVGGTTASPSPSPTATASLDDMAKEVFTLVNAERAKVGAAALKWDSNLAKAANVRAEEIVELYDHIRPNGTSCFTVFDEYKITWQAVAENIYKGPKTPKEAVDGWMNSPGHKANILNEDLTHYATGVYYDGSTYYWVQLFYKDPNAASDPYEIKIVPEMTYDQVVSAYKKVTVLQDGAPVFNPSGTEMYEVLLDSGSVFSVPSAITGLSRVDTLTTSTPNSWTAILGIDHLADGTLKYRLFICIYAVQSTPNPDFQVNRFIDDSDFKDYWEEYLGVTPDLDVSDVDPNSVLLGIFENLPEGCEVFRLKQGHAAFGGINGYTTVSTINALSAKTLIIFTIGGEEYLVRKWS